MSMDTKGQLISKANCQAVNSSKFLEEIEDSKKAFRNYLTFSRLKFPSFFQGQE